MEIKTIIKNGIEVRYIEVFHDIQTPTDISLMKDLYIFDYIPANYIVIQLLEMSALIGQWIAICIEDLYKITPKNNIHQLYDGLSYLGGNKPEKNEAFYVHEDESIEDIEEILDENDSIPTENFLEIHKECNLNFYGLNRKLTKIVIKSMQEKSEKLKKEFNEKYCRSCGTQRCYGVYDDDWRMGCNTWNKENHGL